MPTPPLVSPQSGALDGKTRAASSLPETLEVSRQDDVAILTIARPDKRNALDDQTITGLDDFFSSLPSWASAVVLTSEGKHFSAGLDLSELGSRSATAAIQHSQMWHRAFSRIESAAVPVIAALQGAVIGGGLELACSTHIRVAEASTFYALPEGSRGLFVGGGGSVRIPRLIGAHRMADLMLTGRVLDSSEGQNLGLSNYLVDDDAGLDTALELAAKAASNPYLTNFAILNALPLIAEAAPPQGYFIESLMAAIASSSEDANERMNDFLQGRGSKVKQA